MILKIEFRQLGWQGSTTTNNSVMDILKAPYSDQLSTVIHQIEPLVVQRRYAEEEKGDKLLLMPLALWNSCSLLKNTYVNTVKQKTTK